MAFISFAKANSKFLFNGSIYLIIMLALNFLSNFLQNSSANMEAFTKKIPLMLLINHFFLPICVLKVYIDKNAKEKKLKEDIQKGLYTKEKSSNLELIYNNPMEALAISALTNKDVICLFFIILVDYVHNGSLMYNQRNFEKNSELVLSQYYKFIDVLILIIAYKINKKLEFYRHQYFSLAIIIIFGLGKFLTKFFFSEAANEEITKKFDLKLIIFLVGCPVLDSLKLFYFKKFMVFNFVSPFKIGYLTGFVYLFISILLLIIFYFVHSEIIIFQQYFSMEGLEFPSGLEILLLFIYSLSYSYEFFLEFSLLEKFSPFHLILLATLGDLITDCFIYFKNFPNFDTTELVVRIILYVFEILGILIFIETIILNCCGLNKFVRKNVILRGDEEIGKGAKGGMVSRTQSELSEESEIEMGQNNESENEIENENIH